MIHLWLLNKGHIRCILLSTWRPHKQNGFRVSWKLSLNLGSFKGLRQKRSLVRYLIPLLLWQLTALLGHALVNYNILLLKMRRLAALGRLGSNKLYSITVDGLFYSMIADGIKSFEKIMFGMKHNNFICIFGIILQIFLLVLYWKTKLYFFFKYLIKKQSFLYQCRCMRDSKPVLGKVFLLTILL